MARIVTPLCRRRAQKYGIYRLLDVFWEIEQRIDGFIVKSGNRSGSRSKCGRYERYILRHVACLDKAMSVRQLTVFYGGTVPYACEDKKGRRERGIPSPYDGGHGE